MHEGKYKKGRVFKNKREGLFFGVKSDFQAATVQ